NLGGYHLIWPRDLVESAGGLLAAGAHDDALRALHYLEATRAAGGYWAQNMWLGGGPYWGGWQMGESAFPRRLVDLRRRASRRRTEMEPPRPCKDSFPSKIGPSRMRRRWRSSVPMRWLWCDSAYALPTIRGW